jgi:hypothetical protein
MASSPLGVKETQIGVEKATSSYITLWFHPCWSSETTCIKAVKQSSHLFWDKAQGQFSHLFWDGGSIKEKKKKTTTTRGITAESTSQQCCRSHRVGVLKACLPVPESLIWSPRRCSLSTSSLLSKSKNYYTSTVVLSQGKEFLLSKNSYVFTVALSQGQEFPNV